MCVYSGNETASSLLGAEMFVEAEILFEVVRPTLTAHALILGKRDFALDKSRLFDDAVPKISCNRCSSSKPWFKTS